MRKFNVEIGTDGAAFSDPGGQDELARILRNIADRVEVDGSDPLNNTDERRANDINGNGVCHFWASGIEGGKAGGLRPDLAHAASDLLAACEFVVNDAPEGGDARLTTGGYNRLCAAIAKANGDLRYFDKHRDADRIKAAAIDDACEAEERISLDELEAHADAMAAGINGENAKHTPGPWRTEYESRIVSGPIVAGEGWKVADIGRDPESGDWKANAWLIAAAPDLLAACEYIVGCWDAALGGTQKTEVPFYYDDMTDLRGAITKATEGGAS